MSRFRELSEYKNNILMNLLGNENITKALYYNQSDFLDQPALSDSSTLLYSQIFPYKQNPNTNQEEKTFITMSFVNYKPVGITYKSGLIYFYVFTHINLMQTSYGALRTDIILSEIDELFNRSRGMGIGKLEFYDMSDIQINDSYIGGFIAYKVMDFN